MEAKHTTKSNVAYFVKKKEKPMKHLKLLKIDCDQSAFENGWA